MDVFEKRINEHTLEVLDARRERSLSDAIDWTADKMRREAIRELADILANTALERDAIFVKLANHYWGDDDNIGSILRMDIGLAWPSSKTIQEECDDIGVEGGHDDIWHHGIESDGKTITCQVDVTDYNKEDLPTVMLQFTLGNDLKWHRAR